MPRLLAAVILIIVVTLVASCKKDAEKNDESLFYGIWVNPSHGDTLRFYKKGTQNILRSNQSFNPGLYAPTEQQFRYTDGKLYLYYGVGLTDYWEIEGFKWQTPGRSFEVPGFRIYLFMSSSSTVFNYVKVL